MPLSLASIRSGRFDWRGALANVDSGEQSSSRMSTDRLFAEASAHVSTPPQHRTARHLAPAAALVAGARCALPPEEGAAAEMDVVLPADARGRFPAAAFEQFGELLVDVRRVL